MCEKENRKERLYMKIIDILVGLAIVVIVALCVRRNLGIRLN